MSKRFLSVIRKMFSLKAEGSRSHISSLSYRLSHTACDFAALTYLAVTVVFPAQSLRITLIESALAQSTNPEGEHNQKPDDCPEGLGPPQNCNDIERMAALLAEKRGWGVEGGRAAFRNRAYEVNWHDCTTGNAEMACLINDPCMAQYGEMKMNRSQIKWHATSQWEGKDGNSFECDFTPGTGYGGGRSNLIGHVSDTVRGTSTIDGGENPDPNYAQNQCPAAGSGNYSAVNPFGGGPGGISSLSSLALLTTLLRASQQNKQQQVPLVDIVPTATPTMTPTPEVHIAAAVSSDTDLVGGANPAAQSITQGDNASLLAAVSTDSSNDKKKAAEWEDPRGSIFQ